MATSRSTVFAVGTIAGPATPGIAGVVGGAIEDNSGAPASSRLSNDRRGMSSIATRPEKGLTLGGGGSMLKPPIPGAIRGLVTSMTSGVVGGVIRDGSGAKGDD